MSTNTTLDELLGIAEPTPQTPAPLVPAEPVDELPVPTTPAEAEVVGAAPAQSEAELEDDFQFARKKIRDLIKKVEPALDGAILVAQSGDAPRAFEVVGKMLEGIVNANKELVEIHRTKKETLEKPEAAPQSLLPTGQGGTVNIDKAVFVGRASDLLREIRNAEKKAKELEANASES